MRDSKHLQQRYGDKRLEAALARLNIVALGRRVCRIAKDDRLASTCSGRGL